ncbi:unnamed protein product [Acanthoscelides obtectus]|uniref:Uncharacterized protein n=1 Tax=Acanthoscelides obtectus TaxID=200917 RepID=A0A9P0Q2P4_ACAOB|nr:unnamed protein product [Acanthoscelides obtectus]CAK1670581.1 hypothetical protein AOBTE_LOCUS27690 [Acanthoscelides obtectus]
MYFLKDFVTPYPTQGNLISCNEDSNEIKELHSVENNENNEASDLHSQSSSPSSVPLRTPSRSSSISQVRKRTKKDIQEFLSLETKKIEMWQNEAKDNDNADLLFFKVYCPIWLISQNLKN